jgi:hypothetical protein
MNEPDDLDTARGMIIAVGWSLAIAILAAFLCWAYLTIAPRA